MAYGKANHNPVAAGVNLDLPAQQLGLIAYGLLFCPLVPKIDLICPLQPLAFVQTFSTKSTRLCGQTDGLGRGVTNNSIVVRETHKSDKPPQLLPEDQKIVFK
uniref:Uncharacterized protein n=1 Tax=Oryza barthii TaxID=65489 RepID=A0A0D3G217_9ORYZ